MIKSSEAATGGVKRKLLLQTPQNLQENIRVRASFLVMLQASAWTFIKKETLLQVFSHEF